MLLLFVQSANTDPLVSVVASRPGRVSVLPDIIKFISVILFSLAISAIFAYPYCLSDYTVVWRFSKDYLQIELYNSFNISLTALYIIYKTYILRRLLF